MRKFRLLFLALIALAVPVLAFAQDAPPSPDSVGAAAISALVPVVVMVLVWGVRALAPKIPPILLPILATAIGAASSFVSGLQGATGGSLVKGAALGALAVFLREILTTLGLDVSVKKVGVLFLAVGVGLVSLQGCASVGGPRHVAAVSALGAHDVLKVGWQTESALRCGQPTAVEGHCITPEKDKALAPKFAEAFKYDAELLRLVAVVPEGAPTPAQAADLAVRIYQIIREVLADLPDSPQKAKLVKSLEAK